MLAYRITLGDIRKSFTQRAQTLGSVDRLHHRCETTITGLPAPDKPGFRSWWADVGPVSGV
jgi:hypothetical protein